MDRIKVTSRQNTDLLDGYESLIEHRNRIALEQAKLLDELEVVDKKIVEARGLLRQALNPETITSLEPLAPKMVTKKPTEKDAGTARSVRLVDYHAVLANADPRVQRSLGKVCQLLKRKQMTECTVPWLAEQMKLSPEVARQRLIRAVSVGLLKKTSPSTYAVTF